MPAKRTITERERSRCRYAKQVGQERRNRPIALLLCRACLLIKTGEIKPMAKRTLNTP